MAGLTGKIFDVSGKIGGARKVHPHIVAVEIGTDCLLLPAYTSGGHDIERYNQTIFAVVGVRVDQACVELDNAKHVRFYDSRKGNLATWVVERVDRWPNKELSPYAPVGEMDDVGLLAILQTLCGLIDALPERFSANLRKRARQTMAEVAARIALPAVGPIPSDGGTA
jgi:hypothetical protein